MFETQAIRNMSNESIHPTSYHSIDLLAILSPLVLAADLLLLLGGEVVGDVEGLSDFLGRLALDHVRDGLAADVKKGLDIKVVGGLRQCVSILRQN